VFDGHLKYAFSILLLSCWVVTRSGLAQTDQVVYTDSLQNSWQDWSWSCTDDFNNTSVVHSGTNAIAVILTAGYGAFSLHHSDMDSSPYTNLTFWINGGPTGGQRLQLAALLGDVSGGTVVGTTNLGALPTNAWQQVTVSLAALGAANQPNLTRFWLQDRTGGAQPVFYVDDITLVGGGTPPVTNTAAAITVDAQRNRHPISPLIYGVAFASSNQLADGNFTMNRSGGNEETTYNWQINAHGKGADWYFESYPDSSSTPFASADSFVADSKNGGAKAMITVSMIGWMPKLGSGRSILWSYSTNKYGAQTSSDPYRTDAGNGLSSTNGNKPITWNNPNDANFPTNSTFEQAYVQHFINNWGASTNGGVAYYLMDNEETIWHSTHQDVHPVGATMQEIRTNFFTYAGLVKALDPNALVCAPEEWGWGGYFYSGYDQQNPGNQDRNANGGWDYCPWLLTQFYQRATNTNQRLLDCFTLHCYPQGGEGGSDVSASTQLLRNKSTRQLWDTNYVDQSWIGSQPTNNILMLIPRMRSWVNAYYPGTKIGITEYNWGGEGNIGGATAQADILGIFGREGLDLATRWTAVATTDPVHMAMRMYRNYDGNKSTFGDSSVSVTGPNPDNVSTFAAVRTSDGALTVMVINKQIAVSATASFTINNFLARGTAQVWQLTSANTITRLSDLCFAGTSFSNTVPAQSITLFVLPAAILAGPAGNPNPASGATSVAVNTSLSWKVGTNATLHRVYFGTSSNAVANATTNSPEFKGGLAVTNYTPATQAYGTSYYWRVDEMAGAYATTGAVWSFTTPVLAGVASSPNPANSASGVALNATLSWTAGANASSHQLYFGANSNAVVNATTNAPEFKGDFPGASFAPGVLAASGRFYWRVDEIAGAYVTTGPVWTFATAANGAGGFSLSGDFANGNAFVISFPGQPGQTYRVERSDSLSPASWLPVTDNVPGSNGLIQISDMGVSLQAQRFYRVIILPP
jgi:Glycoside hydrolase family 44